VPRGLQHLQPDPAHLDGVAVGHRRERELGAGAGAEVDDGALAVAQLEMAGHEVRVEVGQEHARDPAAQPVRVRDVLLDVALRVDHRRLAAVGIGDQIARVRQAAQVVLLEDHGVGCGTMRMYGRGASHPSG
jgi:hypothetical protein